MLERSFDVAHINAAANRPDVRPFLGPAHLGELDFSEAIADDHNIFLMGEHGGFALAWSAPGVYEIHVFIAPEGHGRWAAKAREAMVAYARNHGATMIWARIAPSAVSVASYARRGGMKPTGDMLFTLGAAYDVFKKELQ